MKHYPLNEKQFLADLRGLLQIKSVNGGCGPVTDEAPLGKGVYDALEYMLALGRKFGFRTKNLDGYCGWIEMGEGSRLVGIIAHVDTVPVEEDGWLAPPFDGTVIDGRLYGRGACDDKGPAMTALYAMKAVADSGLTPRQAGAPHPRRRRGGGRLAVHGPLPQNRGGPRLRLHPRLRVSRHLCGKGHPARAHLPRARRGREAPFDLLSERLQRRARPRGSGGRRRPLRGGGKGVPRDGPPSRRQRACEALRRAARQGIDHPFLRLMGKRGARKIRRRIFRRAFGQTNGESLDRQGGRPLRRAQNATSACR